MNRRIALMLVLVANAGAPGSARGLSNARDRALAGVTRLRGPGTGAALAASDVWILPVGGACRSGTGAAEARHSGKGPIPGRGPDRPAEGAREIAICNDAPLLWSQGARPLGPPSHPTPRLSTKIAGSAALSARQEIQAAYDRIVT